ncbi:type II toxin-antitoxin system RatA family toxin [Chelatococcus sambhunathii]|uniref:Type II toxin-antitoxin system RatA family toxin n=1 Tax=Chelatococcus sambhunathii TaxID=363953 RepID=A0ABU1DEC8_9HYPH|nr:type II toxin-antitoxin system RatA family toxin [Chelatococcus sambhunathii]MDR4306411.1 type II toxin-antitoxin system RatA family toxin [Chelatococcus sambhunathii]
MPAFRTVRRVPHSPDEMFDLVADVEKYPLFLPLCEALRIRKKEEGVARPVLVADMTIAYKIFRETFTSRVTLDRDAKKILVEYLDGPFRHLENRWTFRPREGGGSEVEFFIEWELKSRSLAMLVGSVFDRVFRRYAEAFEQRADTVYGARPALA